MYQVARAGDPEYLTEGQKALVGKLGYLGYLMNEKTSVIQPKWGGKLSKELGVNKEQFSEVEFQRIWDGYHPTETDENGNPKAIVSNAGEEDRMEATEMVQTMSSTVSTFYYLCNDDEKRQLLEIMQEAHAEVFAWIERNAEPKNMEMREKQDKTKNKLSYCGFAHFENRGVVNDEMNERLGNPKGTVLPDPHLHFHWQVFHTLETEIDGVKRNVALDPNFIYKTQKEASVMMNALIQSKMESRMGVKTVQGENDFSFEVAGVPQSIADSMKKRGDDLKDARKVEKLAKEINQLEEDGYQKQADKLREEKQRLIAKTNFLNFEDVGDGYSAAQLEHMRRASAEAKQEFSYDEIVSLMEGQLAHVDGKGFTREEFDKANNKAKNFLTRKPHEALEDMRNMGGTILELVGEQEKDMLYLKLLDKDGVFKRTAFNEFVLKHYKCKGVGFDSLEQMQQFTDNAFDMYAKKAGLRQLEVNRNGKKVMLDSYTSQAFINTEFEMVEMAKKLRAGKSMFNNRLIDSTIAKKEAAGFKFTQSQKQALLDLKRGTRITYTCGYAGVGKSKAYINTCHELYSQDSNVIGLATGNKVVNELKAEGIKNSFSLAKLRSMHERGILPFDPNQKTTIIIDEVGMVASADLHFVMQEIVMKHPESRLIMVGDYEGQFQSVQAGCGIKNIDKHALGDENRSVIDDIVRQKAGTAAWDLSNLVRDKDINSALNLMEKMGWKRGHKTAEAAKDDLMKRWNDNPLPLRDKLIIAKTNDDVNKLNLLAKETLYALPKGHPDRLERRKEVEITVKVNENDKDVSVKRSFCPNEIVIFKEGIKTTDDKTKIANNTTGRILDIKRNLKGEHVFKIKLDAKDENGNDMVVEIAPEGKKFNNGMCLTAYSSQGATCEEAYCYTTGKVTNNQFYVEMTRAKKATHLFGTHKAFDLLKTNAVKSHEKFNPMENETCIKHWDDEQAAQMQFIEDVVKRRENDIRVPSPADKPVGESRPVKNPDAEPFMAGFTLNDSENMGFSRDEIQEIAAEMAAYRNRLAKTAYKPSEATQATPFAPKPQKPAQAPSKAVQSAPMSNGEALLAKIEADAKKQAAENAQAIRKNSQAKKNKGPSFGR